MLEREILRAEGKLEELKGRAKRRAASAVGNRRGQVTGTVEEVRGKAKQVIAEARTRVADFRESRSNGKE